MSKYICDLCGWEYDPAVGDPAKDIPPNTQFEDLPCSWVCPDCGIPKCGFEPEKN